MSNDSVITQDRYTSHLAAGDFCLTVGPYIYRLKSKESLIADGIATLYSDYRITCDEPFSDYRLTTEPFSLLNRITGRYLCFRYDHYSPFQAVPAKQCYAFLEWGMNWCVSVYANEYLKMHAAVVEKNGAALVMPGLPGAGKSTLSAALVLTGWRLLSDEHTMVSLHTKGVTPLCRPVSLKNESIEIIRQFSNKAVFGPVSEDTHKGRVAHMKSDLADLSHDTRPVPAKWLVFPKYEAGAKLRFSPKPRTESFMFLALHSFNYSLLGLAGFETMSGLVDAVECYDLVYSDMDEALRVIEDMAAGRS